MFVSGKGYLYNTESLGHIDSVIVSYSGGVSTSAKFGVRFADTIMFERISTGNKTIKGRNQSDTVTNNNAESGGYFQLSTSSANCQIVSIKIVYTQGNTTPPIDDIIPPVFSSGYPKAEDVDKDKFDLKVKTNEPCTVFYLVTEGETAPTVDDLLASDKTIAVVAGNTEYTATIEELEPETTYNVYLIAKDTADNVQGTAANLSVTTASATQRTITLRDIESKYYWGETANIKWTALNFDATSDLDSILIFKGNKKIISYSIDITSGEANILIGKGIAPDKNTYATNYSLKVVSGDVESEQSENFTIIPLLTINQLLTDTTNGGALNFKDKIVRVKGIVTGSKLSSNKTYKNFTLQDGDSVSCSIYVYYCVDTTVAIGDSVFVEGKFNVSTANATNGLYRIGSGTTYTSVATKINSGNNLPTPRISTIREVQTKSLMNSLIKIIGANCNSAKSCFFIGEDTIYYKETLYTGDFNLLNNRKYNISGVLGKGTGGRYEIWPRSEADIYLYSNDTTLANLVIGGRDAMNGDTLIFSNINIRGISAATNNEKATLSIRVNNNTVAAADWANVEFAPLDSVFVTVTAEDGTTNTYKRIVDCKTLEFTPLANNSFKTDDEINLSWTSHNISQISLILEIQSDTITLTESTISANLGEWQFTVPNTMFGQGWIKAISNDVVLDSVAVSIADTKTPTIVRQSPSNNSVGLNNSLYINMVFDEPIVVANDAKLKIDDLEFPLMAVGDTAAKAFVSGLDYGTLYNVSLSNGAICDLAGNAVVINNWTFTTKAAPQPDLYFSEYAKGSGSNKYYEIYNPCDTAVDLSRYFVTMNNFSNLATLQLSGWLLPKEVLVVANGSASEEIKRKTDVINSNTTKFTGDDLLGLFRKNGTDTVLIDVLGPYGECETATYWAVAGVEKASTKHSLVRNVVVCGTTDWTESAGTDSLDSQWTVLGENDWTSLGRHGVGHGTEILKMSIGNAAATINSTEATVSVEVPYGTDLTEMAVTRRISQGAQMLINNALAGDTIDFSQPVVATIVAGDSIGRKDWTINVTMAPKPSSDNNILTFSFVETTPVNVTIDTAKATIDAVVAYNLDSLKLTPVITISEFASVSSTLFRSSYGKRTAKTKWDFDEPQSIEVTAQDLTEKVWNVNVTKEPVPHLTFFPLADSSFETDDVIELTWTSHNIDGIDLTLDIQDNTIQLTDSAINANLGAWQFVVPDAMFGNGLIKAARNGIVLDSLAVSIADTKAPTIIRQNPANNSSGLNNSLYINMVFDGPIVIANDAKLKIGNIEFPITAVGDTAAKAFVSGLDYGTLYNVSLSNGAICDLAGNAVTINNWAFTTKASPQPDLYFSEYAKGSGSNKYYEIYNPCDTAVDLSRYFVTMDNFSNLATLQLSGWLLPKEVLVVANGSASEEIKRKTDVINSNTTKFTGDDLLGLFRKDGTDMVLIDVLGPYGECETATYWDAAGVEKASTEHTLVRNVVVCGTSNWTESAGTDSLDSQWTVLGKDIWPSIGRHGIGHSTEILKMSIGGVAATIDGTEATVSIEVPYGTDITKLAVTRRISQGAQIFINDSIAKDTIDFSLPVIATVIAGDSVNRKDWTISVNVGPRPSSDNNVLTFSFVETTPVSVTIDTANATIDAVVAYNLDSLKLTPIITISEFASVSSTLFRSSYGKRTAKTRWNFDEPQSIEVTAQDLTQKVWNVTVTKEQEPHLTLSPLANNTFETDDTIRLSWTSHNIDEIDLALDIQNNTVHLTDSTISADLGGWQYVVPNTMFGNGKLKALRNGIALDSLTLTISDTKAPEIVRQRPTNGSEGVNNSLYISMVFDEPIIVANDAKLKIGDLEFSLMTVGDTAAKAFVNGLNYSTLCNVGLSYNAICDLSGNAVVINDWTFTTKAAPQPELYFSEYAKGSGSNKYYEIYNPCDTAVDLSRYFVTMNNFSSLATLQLSGWLLQNEVLVVANGSATDEIKRKTDVINSNTTKFTGDDLLGLFRKDGTDTVLIDVLGPYDEYETATYWAAAGVEKASTDHTLVRNVVICGTTNWTESAGTDSLDSQWTVLGKDIWTRLGRHGIGHGTEILKMSIGGVAATIDLTEATVSVEVPYGTDLTKMAVTRRISQGAQMFINNVLAPDTLDFSQPVVATIVAGDSIGRKDWTVNVTMAPKPSSNNNILTFSFVETTPVNVTIDTANATINVIVAYNLDSLKLTPIITIFEKASVPSALFRTSYGKRTAKTRWNFDEPQSIEVTAQDLTKKIWNVNVTKEPEPHLTFSPLANNSFETGDTIRLSWTSHNIDEIDLVLDIQNNTIQLTDSAINANLDTWQFVVPDAMFGDGLIKVLRNGIALDSLAVTIADTKAPTIVRQTPANSSEGVYNYLYISMVFNEPIVVADDARLKIGDLEFPITAVGDTATKAFVSGIDYGTSFEITLSNGAICDLAGNSATLGDWTFTTKAAPQPDLYFSEYAKGSGSNKYYEIYNPCDTAVDLSRYFVTMNNFSSLATLQLSGWLLQNEVLVVANGSATDEIKRKTDVINSNTTKFTGDDLLGLFRKDGTNTVLIDVLGPYGECETATYWAVAGVEKASTEHTLVRNIVVCGTTDWTESAGIDSLDSQWTVLGKDDWTDLGRHGIGHGTEILKMRIGGIAATIDRTEATVSVEVPYGTDLTKMAVTRRISQGAQMLINNALASDTLDFSQPVLATIVAGDSIGRKDWTINVTMAPKPSSANNILTFSFVEITPISVEIDTANATIDAIVAYNLDSLKLTPVITISEFASVSSTLFRTSYGKRTAKTMWNFDKPQTIEVTAQDLTQKIWNVTVTKEPEPHLTFSSLANNTFETGDTIRLSWTSHNIDEFDLVLVIQGLEIQITDSTISADLGGWQYVVPNTMFGNGLIKAVRNGIVLDNIAVSITDTKTPTIVRQTPSNNSIGQNNSLYISMVFDEPIVVANDAKLKIGDLVFPITAVGDTAAKAFANGLSYSTVYNISLSNGAIKDSAGNAVTINDWTFTTKAAPQPDLYFSEYAKGSGSNKYYEIYNPCDTTVDLSRYFVTMDNFSSLATLQLSGWLLPDEVLVVANGSATNEIKRKTDLINSKTTNFTGDDVLGLFRKDGGDIVLIDVLGPFGECETAAYWAVAGIENASTNHTLVRNVVVCGTTDWAESAGTGSLDSQWTVLGKDIWTNIGRHGVGHGTEILKMSIGGAAATIDGTEATVSIEVPFGTDITKLAVTRRISQGAQMLINDALAGDTINFSQPVVATIIAGDSVNRKDWTISVNVGPRPSSDKNILTFSFVETTPVNVTIDTANATIDAIVVYNLDSLKLTPIITIFEKASVPSALFRTSYGKRTAKTRWNFDEPQTITVTAEDLTQKIWNVTVTKESEPHLTFSPLAYDSFETGATICLSWTSHNIDGIVLVLDIQGSAIQLTDSTISADLGGWQYVVPDAMFGNGLVKAVRNGIVLDSLAVNISDTKAPIIVRQSLANGSEGVNNSLYINMVFDEPIVVANDAKLKIGDLVFPITAVGDTAVKAFAYGLNYSTLYNVSLSYGAVKDLAGNVVVIDGWTFTTQAAPLPDLYFSEYAKGSGSNKYYEIYNPCDTAVDLSCYFVTMDNFTSSSRSQVTLQLSGLLLPDEVLVVANSGAAEEIKKRTDVSTTKTTGFTGDDLLGLFRKDGTDTVLIDILGPFGECETAAYWAGAGIENASTNHTLVRNVVVCGTTNWTESAGTDSLDSQWTVLDKDNFSDLGRHGVGHGTEILKMSINGVAATINSTEATVSVEVPYGTDPTEMAVAYRISQGAQILINNALATDTIDFSQPVIATVIAGDSVNRKDWTINVNVGPRPSSDKNILTFSFGETTPVNVTIDTAIATINVVVAYNLDSLKLTPVITISEFASVSSTLFRTSYGKRTAKTRWNFDEPQSIEVTAQDLTQKVWNVQVSRESAQALTIKDIAKLDGGLIANAGKPVVTEGIVIHIVTTTKGTELYIQDSAGMWSGIMVVDEGNQYAATLAVGDRIKISGIVEENFGMARISQIEALTVSNSDINVQSDTIIVEDARSVAYQNALVTIDSVVCTGGFDNLFTVQDSTNSIIVYNKYKFNDFALEIDSMYRITGIVYYTSADGSYRLIPRSADDIVKLVRPAKPVVEPKPETPKPDPPQPQEPDTTTVSVIGSTAIGLTAYTANRAIVIENATSAVSVFDIAGRLIATARPAPRIVINAPHTGIYIIRTRQNAIKLAVE